MEKINILACTDDNYVPQCGIMLNSLFENNKELGFRVFIIGGGNRENRQIMKGLCAKYGAEVEFVDIDISTLDGFAKTIKATDHVSLAAYYRLFCSLLLPKDVDRLLYLDCDIIVNGHVKELYDSDIEGYAVGGIVDESYQFDTAYRRLGLDIHKDRCINSGVLLINLRYWREHQVMERCLDCVREMQERLLFHDQDTINLVLKDEIAYLPIRWNFQTAFLYCIYQDSYSAEMRREIADTVPHPAIIHYTGKSKPWIKGCRQPYTSYFIHYKELSPWREWPLQGSVSVKSKVIDWLFTLACMAGLKKKVETYIIKPQEYVSK